MKNRILSLACCFLLTMPVTTWALGAKPEPLNREENALLGIYAGLGTGFAIGEKNGQLEMIYPHLRRGKDNDPDTLNKDLPLKRNHYDEYSFVDNTPNFTAADTLNFDRDGEGRGISLRLGDMNYNRRFTNGEDGKPFRVKLTQPLSKLRQEAAKESVPKHTYAETAQLVDLAKTVPGLHYDLRYTTRNNLFGEPLVLSKQAYLDKDAALALGRVRDKLKSYGYGLVVWEAYRSWQDFKLATLALGPKHKNMLPSPDKGFSHNTGRSIALSLFDLSTGEAVPMISDFDELTPAQYSDYLGGSSLQRWQRDLLRETMESQGFKGSEAEWWHFDYNSKVKYQLLNITVK